MLNNYIRKVTIKNFVIYRVSKFKDIQMFMI